MKTVVGNLLDLAEQGHFDVIVHGCNCFCTMNSGIAKEIRQRWPWVYTADQSTIKGDKYKLGTYTSEIVHLYDFENGTQYHPFTVVNAYTQYMYGRDKQHADYEAIRSVFNKIGHEFYGKRIGYPKIGAGLAGGDWNIISDMINEELEGLDHTLVVFEN